MIVFDVEAVPLEGDEIHPDIFESINEKYSKIPKTIKTDEAIIRKIAENAIKRIKSMSVDPYLCKPVAICLITDCDYHSGKINGDHISFTGSEGDMLQGYWDVIDKTRHMQNSASYLTFNGKKYDVPLLMARSAFHGIKPSLDVSTRRYEMFPHCDLYEVLQVDYKNFKSLDFYCKYFGIPSPKNDFEASMVYEAYKNGGEDGLKKIVSYCFDDCEALFKLFYKVAPVYYRPQTSRYSPTSLY